jgi:E3 ubiquitin-protein ligase RNF115/126
MENSNAHRPVPATDEIMEKLPREVLEAGCKSLSSRYS